MITEDQARELLGRDAYGPGGDKIGKIGQIFLDDQTGQPEWVTVHTGLFGSKESFVPLADAQFTGEGLTVPYDKDKIKSAPSVDVDAGHLSQQEEGELYSYYGLHYTEATSDSGLPAGGVGGTSGTQTSEFATGTAAGTGIAAGTGVSAGTGTSGGTGTSATTGRGVVGNDISGPETDEAMTRSEERLRVGTQRVEAGRVRLRKYIVSEQVQQSVPVTREEVRIQREPITDANMGAAMSGPALSEEEHEVVLHEERPVVEKEVVPVERVRVDVDTIQEQVTVRDQVRKEEIELVEEGTTTGGVSGTTGTGTSGTGTSGTGDDDRGLLDKAKDALGRGDGNSTR